MSTDDRTPTLEDVDTHRGVDLVELETQRGLVALSAAGDQLVLGLTIIHHEDVRRIGAVARLGDLANGGSVEVSRLVPEFIQQATKKTKPLASQWLSRQPVTLQYNANEGMTIECSVPRVGLRVNGATVTTNIEVSSEELKRGVVLELADRVALLLHWMTAAHVEQETLGLVGESSAMVRLRRELTRVAETQISVLIRGETGVGKELAARAIHEHSDRSSAPYISVNMAAIPPTTAASDLFGHVRGAFTGADREHSGYFGAADGGTLFLDEIGEVPSEIQPMLLRVLESGEIQPVGGKGVRRVNVRLVAATDADLEASIEQGLFRRPLLHRLAGYEISIPPLRERRDDIARILIYFLKRELASVGALHRLERSGKTEKMWLSTRLIGRLISYNWPGNVRQLVNIVRHIVVCGHDREQVPQGEVLGRLESITLTNMVAPPTGDTAQKKKRRPADISDDEVAHALSQNEWELAPTAKSLGIARNSLYALINRHPTLRTAAELADDELKLVWEQCGGDLEKVVQSLKVSRRALRLRATSLGLSQ